MKEVSQEFFDKVAALGYTEEQARRALEVGEGNVDDAIDFLYSCNGDEVYRASAEPKKNAIVAEDNNTSADSTIAKKEHSETEIGASTSNEDDIVTADDVSVMTESSLQTLPTSNVTKPPATSSLSHMAMRQAIANRKPIAPNMARRSLSLTEIPETEEVPSHPDNAEITDVDTGLSMYLNEENQDAKSPSLRIPDSNGMMNDDLDPNKSETIAITEKIPSQEPAPTHHRQANNTSRLPNATTSRPGAFPMTGGPIALRQVHDRAAEPQGPQPTRANQVEREPQVEAELVDPDVENQILEKRIQEHIEAERTNTAVATVVSEDELKTFQWRRVVCVVGVVFVAIAIAVALTVTKTQPSSSAPTMAPTLSPAPTEIIELLAFVSFDGGASLNNASSPQSAAARWLADNKNLGNYSDERKIQRYALATLYYSTNGDNWDDKQNWTTDGDECHGWWSKPDSEGGETKRLSCNSNGSITILNIEDNNLHGTLPEEIALLSSSMFELSLKDNEIGGKLPSTLGKMTRLKTLDLEKKNFSSTILTEFGNMMTLENLRLASNSLSGDVPSELRHMTFLEDLRLSKNNLSGKIDGSVVESLKQLHTLTLSENNFTSTIPIEIGLLTLLKELKLHRNLLVGHLITEIGRLTALEKFACHENRLTGPLPSELGNLAPLKDELRAASNLFNGTIPELASLTGLEKLHLGDNDFTGTIPSSLGLLTALQRLELHENHLVGSIPASLGDLTLMVDLGLQENNLTGTILSEFMQFPNLQSLNLRNNSFTGTLPPFGNLTDLKSLDARLNMLTSSIPSSIAGLTSLETLKLDNNELTGTVPNVIFGFKSIQKIHLYNNSFAGNATCPSNITDCFLSCFDEMGGNKTCRML
jgi:Leucine-rich repeat (LRR) protein